MSWNTQHILSNNTRHCKIIWWGNHFTTGGCQGFSSKVPHRTHRVTYQRLILRASQCKHVHVLIFEPKAPKHAKPIPDQSRHVFFRQFSRHRQRRPILHVHGGEVCPYSCRQTVNRRTKSATPERDRVSVHRANAKRIWRSFSVPVPRHSRKQCRSAQAAVTRFAHHTGQLLLAVVLSMPLGEHVQQTERQSLPEIQ